jgi:two-component system, cell cycle sensor histidine kinase and response regulator CckA
MGGQSADSAVKASRPKRFRPLPLSFYLAGVLAVFVLAAGAGLAIVGRRDQLSGGLLAITLGGLLVLAAASAVFYWRIVRPIIELNAQVREVMTDLSAGPLTVTGAPEVTSLVRDINTMIETARTDAERSAALAAIVQSSADAIISKTLDGIITSWNAGAERQYGYAANEVIGRSISVIIPAGRAGELAPILDRIRRGDRIEQLETRRRRKDGIILDVSISFSPIRNASGAVTGAAAVARDISERTRLEAEHRAIERRRQQSERLESLGQLAGGIAHDFNNLLGIIINYASFAAEEAADRPAIRADLEHVQAAAEQAARITRQLLIVGRRDSTQPELLGLNAIIADTRELLVTALGAGIEIRVETADGLPAIEADRGQVGQLLLNLALNARDAMPAGGTLTIETGVTEFTESMARAHPGARPGRYVHFIVSDTGNGMSADAAEHIFDPFFTTKPIGQGTGLGLATVHGIVTRAGGSISVESEPGAGTIFRVLLPAAAAAVPAQPVARVPEARGSGQTILVVDDEPSVLELTSRILRQNGYSTLDAGSFEEALSLASAEDLQLLLTDSVMPRMSGPTIAEHIVRMRPGVPVLYMSGHSSEALNPHISDGGAEYIQKPFTPHDLLEKVHSALNATPRPRAGS